MDVYDTFEDPVMALAHVPKKLVPGFGVIGGKKVGPQTWQIDRFVEKPSIKAAPSNLIVIGRYILTPNLCAILKKQAPGKDGEIRLANAFETYLTKRRALYGCAFDGAWYNCGNKLGFLMAQVELGLRHPEIGNEFKVYLKKICRS
jgi:UTP--glucose-1-phosphate uridylyltransferase